MRTNVVIAIALTALIGCGTTGTSTPTAPTSTLSTSATHTNAIVTIQANVNGDADKVELLIDGTATPLTSPYTYAWDTTSTPEGAHELKVRVTKGTATGTSTAATVIVDRTAPTIIDRTPVPDVTNVYVRDPISVTFSETIKASTVTATSVLLSADGAISITKALEVAGNGRTLTASIIGSPGTPTTLTMALTGGITDLAGNALNFTSWSWNLPEWFSLGKLSANSGSTNVFEPSLALDGNGNPVAAWVEENGTSPHDVHVQRWTGSAWQPVGEALSAVTGSTNARHASLALDSNGNPAVAWYESDGTTQNVYVQRWTGSAWQAVGEALSAVTGSTVARDPSLALDGNGNPVVAWNEFDGTTENVHVQRWTGSAWQPVGGAISAYPGNTRTGEVSLALDGSGQPVVAWSESDGASAAPVHVQQWTGSAWEAVGGTLSAASRSTFAPSLVLDGNDYPVVLWMEYDELLTLNQYTQRLNK